MRHAKGIVASIALSALLLSGAYSRSQGNNIPGTSITLGQAIGIVVGSGAAIAIVTVVLVHNAHPTLKGCVTAGPGGMLVHNQGDDKTYALTGTTADIKAGDLVKVQGKKVKKQKDSAGNQDFTVLRLIKNYGACKAPQAPAGTPASAASE
jgi:hypothetical protein